MMRYLITILCFSTLFANVAEITSPKVILSGIDYKYQITVEDYRIIEIIRKYQVPKILVVNKAESKLSQSIEFDCKKIGTENLFSDVNNPGKMH